MALPTFVGIGVGRSGTRWLSQCLSEHPEIYVHPDEVYFFVTRRPHSTWSRGLEWYSSLFEKHITLGKKAWGEITPVYLFDQSSPHLLHRYVPEVKLICSIRDQSEMAYSTYRLFLAQNPDIYGTKFSFWKFLIWSDIIQLAGFYLEHLKRYMEVFPRENLLILLYDDLQRDPASYVQQVFRFLDVDGQFRPQSLLKRINPQELKVKRMKILERVSTYLTRNRHPLSGVGHLIDSLNKTAVRRDELPGRHRMAPGIRSKVAEMCREHNEQLGDFLGRDLSHWNTERSG